MSAARAGSRTKKTSKIVPLSAAALTAAVGLGTAAVIFGPAAATGRQPDRAAQLDPRQGSQLVQIAVAKPAGASDRAFTGVISARVQSNLGFRVPGKVIAPSSMSARRFTPASRSCASTGRISTSR
jgi:hypothetical protein